MTFRTRRSLKVTVAALGVLLLTRPARADSISSGIGGVLVIHTSVSFTELSSTNLMASVGTVTLMSPDQWLWTPPPPPPGLHYVPPIVTRSFWLEPESPPILSGNVVLNELAPSNATDLSVTIISDFQAQLSLGPPPINSDGVTVPNAILYGAFDTTGLPVSLTFYDVSLTDHAASSELPVPEPASMLLLGSGLLGLAGLWRMKRTGKLGGWFM